MLRRALAGDLAPETIIDELNASGLKGMGGAGFPTGKKWELVRAQENHPKYAICNADESEPGTFKDRQILAEQPHLVLEGLLLGMLVCGSAEGWVFIRHEYGPEEVVLHEEIERLHDLGLLGHDVLGSGKRLQLSIFTSPGGYILGEETALIECMEGHRGEPRNKPPFPGIYGLHGQPTVMNSVETLAHIPIILDKGSDWWNDQGTGESTGLKFFSVSGDVAEPAVYCVPMGTTAAELIEQRRRDARRRPSWPPSSPAARRRTSCRARRPTCGWTSSRCRRRARCSARERSWRSRATATCWPPPPTSCASSATSPAASACRAVPARPRRTRSSPSTLPPAAGRPTWTTASRSSRRRCG